MTTGSFPHDNFSSVYWIFAKLDHMIPLRKGKNLFILGSLPLYRLIIYIDRCILWCTHFLFYNGKEAENFRHLESIQNFYLASNCDDFFFELMVFNLTEIFDGFPLSLTVSEIYSTEIEKLKNLNTHIFHQTFLCICFCV